MRTTSHDDPVLLLNYEEDRHRYNDQVNEAEIVRSSRIIWCVLLLLIVLVTWSYFASIVEVSKGTGKVIPTSREQVIQSLEGGILSDLYVREGDFVEEGQTLAQLDLTKTEATVEESAARYRALVANVARLQAEVNQTELAFPEELADYPNLMIAETRLFETRKAALDESLAGLQEGLALVK